MNNNVESNMFINNDNQENTATIAENELYPNLNRLHRYNRNDPIFDDLNIERNNTLSKQKCIYFKDDEQLQEQDKQQPTSNNNNNKNNNNNSNNNNSNKTSYICSCPIQFNSLIEYENHCYGVHKNICRICKKKSYSSNKLLECHLLETHDKMFETLCLKKKMFECLVCDQMFWSDYNRKIHLVNVHKYPKEFHFHSKQRSKELEVIRLKGIEFSKILKEKSNSKSTTDSPNNSNDKMELDKVIMDIESFNTK